MNRHKCLMFAALTAGMAALGALPARATPAQDAKAAAQTHPLVGKPAPDLQGDFALNGKAVKLSDLKGKVVLLEFWAVWCLPCVEALPQLEQLHAKYKDAGLEIVAVTFYNHDRGIHLGLDKKTGKLKTLETSDQAGEQAMLKDFVAFHKMQYRVLALSKADRDKALEAYEVQFIPQVVLIDRQGVVRQVVEGKEKLKDVEAGLKKLIEGDLKK